MGGDGTSADLLPRNITVINNTVISGLSNSLRFGQAYATLPLEQRPLVVNNTGERLRRHVRPRPQRRTTSSRFGQACSAEDVIGNPDLDANGVPTAASTLLINRGDPAAAPATDFFGYRAHGGAPDIGAIESARARRAPPPLKRPPRRGSSARQGARGLHRPSCACARATPRASP